MSTATLTSKGQVTIPVDVRNDLKDMIGPPKKTVSIDSMNAAIAKGGAVAR
jgi:bifunctional DNA-binding transcriptional regulator/antitoxin component of YhaV-PrlF toxin-antitoxin module